MVSVAASVQRWHCDAPILSPDGVRVAYVQWDSPFVRIVVVNLDRPGDVNYFNLGSDWAEPVDIFWNASREIELRKGSDTFAVFKIDDKPPGAVVETVRPPAGGPNPAADSATIDGILRRKLPHRAIHLLNWDTRNRRILLLADTINDRGRYFVYDRSLDLLFEVARRKASTPTR